MPPDLKKFLSRHPDTVLVEIAAAKGSTPREAGAVMLVSETDIWGTIGGGQLEFMAVDNARAMLSQAGGVEHMNIALGPEIGQCCGGRVQLRFHRMTQNIAAELNRKMQDETKTWPDVFLFGGGHVGEALAAALDPLPVSITMVETRDIGRANLPARIDFRREAMPESVVAAIPPGSAVVILTHDHALDFMIAKEALARPDLAYVGMIGSATKRATFASWLAREGGQTAWLDRLTLPIGGNAVHDKRPAVIAAMVAAELMTAFARNRPPV